MHHANDCRIQTVIQLQSPVIRAVQRHIHDGQERSHKRVLQNMVGAVRVTVVKYALPELRRMANIDSFTDVRAV